MKAKVLKTFGDAKRKKLRLAGKVIEVSEERFKELNSTRNGLLLEEVAENEEDFTVEKTYPFPKHTGGGWYEITNGEKVQGKEKAEELERKLRGW
ncbi:MAG TPA: hypothetical protein GX707_12800 [Epulopiscium sp.]|nr:hypothetical protein [Candidatus Epulonipiscium sp.]